MGLVLIVPKATRMILHISSQFVHIFGRPDYDFTESVFAATPRGIDRRFSRKYNKVLLLNLQTVVLDISYVEMSCFAMFIPDIMST